MTYEKLERNGQAHLATGMFDDIMAAILKYETAVTVPLVLGVLEMVKADIVLHQVYGFVIEDDEDEDDEE